MFKIENCGSYGQLQQKNERLETSKRNLSEKRLLSCSHWSVHCKRYRQKSLTKAKDRATCAGNCQCVSVQKYSVQYKGYKLIGVTTVEGGTTRGTTALVYY